MSDDLNKKIKQLTDVLSQEKLPDNLQTLLSLLASSSPKPVEEEPAIPSEPKDKHEDRNDLTDKLGTLMETMGKTGDPRVTLLNSLRPFLNNTRQNTLNNCIKFIQLSSMTRIFNEADKFK